MFFLGKYAHAAKKSVEKKMVLIQDQDYNSRFSLNMASFLPLFSPPRQVFVED